MAVILILLLLALAAVCLVAGVYLVAGLGAALIATAACLFMAAMGLRRGLIGD